MLGCALLLLFLQFWTPVPGIEFRELEFCSFCAGTGFDFPAIPRVRSGSGIPFLTVPANIFLFPPKDQYIRCLIKRYFCKIDLKIL
jgi:hypothetical protein